MYLFQSCTSSVYFNNSHRSFLYIRPSKSLNLNAALVIRYLPSRGCVLF